MKVKMPPIRTFCSHLLNTYVQRVKLNKIKHKISNIEMLLNHSRMKKVT